MFDVTWKFPTMTVLLMSLFNVGEYTGYPVEHACLTTEEGREEMWGDIHLSYINVLVVQVNCLPCGILRHLRILIKSVHSLPLQTYRYTQG